MAYGLKVSSCDPLKVFAYVVTECSISLAISIQLQKNIDFSFGGPGFSIICPDGS